MSFINSNYSGSELTAFITLTAALLDVQVCSYSTVCMCLHVPATEGKTDESVRERNNVLSTGCSRSNESTGLFIVLHSNIFSFCLCFINPALSFQGELITIFWRSVHICSSSMCASGSHTQTCLPSQRCRLASTRQSGSPATVSRPH